MTSFELRWVGVVILELIFAGVTIVLAAHVNAEMQRPKD